MNRAPLLLSLALLACASPQEQLDEAEGQVASNPNAAAQSLDELLQSGDLDASQTTRANLARARADLELGNLDAAESRLQLLDDDLADKHALLGAADVARARPRDATAHLRRAFELAPSDPTRRALARALAGEARDTGPLREAHTILAAATATSLQDEARGLDTAANVWRDLLAGQAPAVLLARFEADGLALAEDYPTLQVLQARLYDRLSRTEEADALWALSAPEPPVSDDFRAWATALRAKLALETGDEGQLERALESGDPVAAAAFRRELARDRMLRGDLEGAAFMVRRTAEGEAEAAAPDLGTHALLQHLLGRGVQAEWSRAVGAAQTSNLPRLRSQVAHHLTQQGDPYAARVLLAEVSPYELPPRWRTTNRAALDAARALVAASDALRRGEPTALPVLARALRLLAPTSQADACLEALAQDLYADPRGLSGDAYARTVELQVQLRTAHPTTPAPAGLRRAAELPEGTHRGALIVPERAVRLPGVTLTRTSAGWTLARPGVPPITEASPSTLSQRLGVAWDTVLWRDAPELPEGDSAWCTPALAAD